MKDRNAATEPTPPQKTSTIFLYISLLRCLLWWFLAIKFFYLSNKYCMVYVLTCDGNEGWGVVALGLVWGCWSWKVSNVKAKCSTCIELGEDGHKAYPQGSDSWPNQAACKKAASRLPNRPAPALYINEAPLHCDPSLAKNYCIVERTFMTILTQSNACEVLCLDQLRSIPLRFKFSSIRCVELESGNWSQMSR